MSDLQIDENLAFEERQWRWQRVGWAVFGLLIVAAALGVFGGGPLTSATVGDDGVGLVVDYQRVVRHQGEADLTVRVSREHVEEGQVALWLDAGFVHDVRIGTVSPEPAEVRVGADRVVWVFAVEPGEGDVTVTWHYTPQDMGWQRASLGSGSGQVSFGQVVLP